jgi:transcriptional regulator with XRE-family HTH domain
MSSLLKQLKKRRISLGFKQNDMLLRIGISRQQYQRLESKGNPRLDTLELIAKGLNSELMLIPQEKLNAVLAVLENEGLQKTPTENKPGKSLSDDPWQGLIDDEG